MNKGKGLMQWHWKGRKLANPVVIVWKLIWFIPYQILRVILCLVGGIGFGLHTAEMIWKDTA